MNENLLALPFSGNGKGPAVNANLIFGMIDRGDFILCRFNRIRIAGGEVNRLSITCLLYTSIRFIVFKLSPIFEKVNNITEYFLFSTYITAVSYTHLYG